LSNPQTLNLYSYTRNNPLSLIDEDGHCWSWIQGACDFFQKTFDWVRGAGFITFNELDQRRSFLVEHAADPKSADNLKHESAKDVTRLYNCANDPQCLAAWNSAQEASQTLASMMMTQWGWTGQQSYKQMVNQLRTPNTPEGTVDIRPGELGGKTPTEAEAIRLIEDAGGSPRGPVEAHEPGGVSTHTYDHINYTLADGTKGTIAVQP
jgi:hypothetical protein